MPGRRNRRNFFQTLWQDERGELTGKQAEGTGKQAEGTGDTEELRQRNSEQQQQIQQQQQQLQQIWAQSQAGPAATGNAAPPDSTQREQVAAAFWERPFESTTAVAQRAAMQAVQAVQAKNYPRDVEAARDKARGEDADVFDRFKDEIEAYMGSSYAPEAHTDTRVWASALATVKSRHFDELIAEKIKTKIAVKGGPESPSVAQAQAASSADASSPLEGDEKKVAREIFHFTDAEYRRGQKNFKDQESVDDPLKTPWGAHVKNRVLHRDGRQELRGPGPMLTLDSELQGRRTRRESADG